MVFGSVNFEVRLLEHRAVCSTFAGFPMEDMIRGKADSPAHTVVRAHFWVLERQTRHVVKELEF